MVLYSRVRAPKWSANENPELEAKCRKLPRPQPGADPFFEDEDKAMRICNGRDSGEGYVNAGKPCPVRHQCLIFALINHEGSGVWGGMLTHDRMTIKRHLPREWWYWHPPTPKPARQELPDEDRYGPRAA